LQLTQEIYGPVNLALSINKKCTQKFCGNLRANAILNRMTTKWFLRALVAIVKVDYEDPNIIFKRPLAYDLLFISLSFKQIL
jgi:hypothetical protein